MIACPCCGYATLGERGGYEICPVCFWEDDGQDDVDAHIARGGPNRGTLWAARAYFLAFGACDPASRAHVRPPAEPRLRAWGAVDDVVVEERPAADVSVWNLLHDGTVTGLRRHEGRVSVEISAMYLQERFGATGFRVELFDVARITYTPYDQPEVGALDEIVRLEPEIGSSRLDGDAVAVWSHEGVLRLAFRAWGLRFSEGAPLAVAALAAEAAAYWAVWEAAHRR